MADTDIEWATKVWNPTRGCRRISPGCGGPHNQGGCYAERQAMRMSGPGGAYEGLVQLTPNGPRWTGAGRFAPDKLDEPIRWSGSQRVFVDSMSDLFFEEFTNEQIAAVFGVMAACRQHEFLVLTKRALAMRGWFDWLARECREANGGKGCTPILRILVEAQRHCEHAQLRETDTVLAHPWPLPNVWLGVSCEDQERADERIPHLLATPAAVRFASAEPLLGPLELSRWLPSPVAMEPEAVSLDWIIVGGESGRRARRFDIAWARSIVRQCRVTNVACFMKQLGAEPVEELPDLPESEQWAHLARGPLLLRDGKGGDPDEWPSELRIREFPKGARQESYIRSTRAPTPPRFVVVYGEPGEMKGLIWGPFDADGLEDAKTKGQNVVPPLHWQRCKVVPEKEWREVEAERRLTDEALRRSLQEVVP